MEHIAGFVKWEALKHETGCVKRDEVARGGNLKETETTQRTEGMLASKKKFATNSRSRPRVFT
jgi:hypothetical protein